MGTSSLSVHLIMNSSCLFTFNGRTLNVNLGKNKTTITLCFAAFVHSVEEEGECGQRPREGRPQDDSEHARGHWDQAAQI